LKSIKAGAQGCLLYAAFFAGRCYGPENFDFFVDKSAIVEVIRAEPMRVGNIFWDFQDEPFVLFAG
jgi:hypothetical protein